MERCLLCTQVSQIGDYLASLRTALVVDDNVELAADVATVLRHKRFEVRVANNGLHGYASYFSGPTDLVLTDLQMPELDGVAMMRCIRAVNPNVRAVYYRSGAIDLYRTELDREQKEFSGKVIE